MWFRFFFAKQHLVRPLVAYSPISDVARQPTSWKVYIIIINVSQLNNKQFWKPFTQFVLLFFFSSYFLFPSVWFDLSVAGTGTFFLGRISGQSQILYPGPDVENNNLDPDPKETMRIQAEGESGRVTILWTGWIRIVSNESGSVIFVLFCRYLGTDPN